MFVELHNWWKLARKFPEYLVLAVSLILYLAVTLPAFFQPHFFLNLEPYPDGLFYVGQALQLAKGEEIHLNYQGLSLPTVVPPGYSLVLAVGFLFSNWPGIFYLSNIALGCLSICFLWLILRNHLKQWWVIAAGLLLYLSHAYILWLPAVPMAENLTILLTLVGVYVVTLKRVGLKELLLTIGVFAWLVITKYAYILIAVMGCCLVLYRLIKEKNYLLVSVLLTAGVCAGSAGLVWLLSQGINPFLLFMPGSFGKASDSGIVYYSFEYIFTNTQLYLNSLLGFNGTPFLWLRNPLSSAGILMLAVLGSVQSFSSSDSRKKWLGTCCAVLGLSTLPLFLVFYTSDSRYLIHLVPISVVLGSLWLDSQSFMNKTRTALLVSLVLVLHMVTQLVLYKETLVANWLGRTQAWQQQAVTEMNSYFSKESDGIVVTALPPFMVKMYGTTQYRVLPLSLKQEFLNKEQNIWDKDLPTHNLLEHYKSMVEAGQTLYITNAYITHNRDVVADYELFKNTFKLELVHSGCHDACSIYRLEL
jgi:hypothetical protein